MWHTVLKPQSTDNALLKQGQEWVGLKKHGGHTCTIGPCPSFTEAAPTSALSTYTLKKSLPLEVVSGSVCRLAATLVPLKRAPTALP